MMVSFCQSFRPPASQRQQQGVALIFALVIVGIVTGLSVTMSLRHDRTLSLAESRWHGNQARQYLLGAEQLALWGLEEDHKADSENDPPFDSHEEAWAQANQFPTDEGWIEAQLRDGHSKLDVNRLGDKPQSNQPFDPFNHQRYTVDQRRFLRLLQTFEQDGQQILNLSQSVEILEAIVDWIDADNQDFGFGGAENLYYQRQDPPLIPPNQPLKSVSELAYVRHMTPEIFKLIAPHLTVLPRKAELNINTIEGPLLRTLNSAEQLTPLPIQEVEDFLVERGGTGFESIEAFKNTQLFLSHTSLSTEGLGVRSEFFELTGKVLVGRQQRVMYSQLFRDNSSGKARVIRRSDFAL